MSFTIIGGDSGLRTIFWKLSLFLFTFARRVSRSHSVGPRSVAFARYLSRSRGICRIHIEVELAGEDLVFAFANVLFAFAREWNVGYRGS